jgi:hypothetical protein
MYVFLRGGGVVSWQSKKQTMVAFSSTKFEYISTISTTKEAMWLRQLFNDFSTIKTFIITL